MTVCCEVSDEVWYPIPGYPGYEFSSDQRVRSFRRQGGGGGINPDQWKIMTPRVDQDGYARYGLRRNGKRTGVFLHQIVAWLAYGETPDGLMTLHGDDDKTNNHASNLTFGTAADNRRDAFRNGKVDTPRGEKRGHAKLNGDVVRKIRSLYASGEYQKDIAKRFNVCQAVISGIVTGRRWNHVSQE